MTMEMKRPERKFQDVKVSEADIVLFTLGIDKREFILPSERDSYLTDLRAVTLVENIKAGKDVSNKDYTGINLKGADLSGANFKGCNFSKSCFYQTKAKNCDFEGAKFDDSFMEDCDFSKAKFKDVSFKYPFDDFDVIKNINLTIKSGETIGIVGPTGSGKSTLVRQLLREFNVTKGKILIDDIPIEEYMIEDVRNMVGYVPQEHILFRRSVDDNILIGNKKKSKSILLDIIGKSPNNYYAHKLLAEIYEQEGGLRKAIDEYVQAIDINKQDYDSYYKVANLLTDLDKKDEAAQMLNNLLQKNVDTFFCAYIYLIDSSKI